MIDGPLTDRAIGIDYTAAYEQGGGIGRLVRDLITHVAQQDPHTHYKLFVAGATRDQLSAPLGSNFRYYPTRITPRSFARLWQRARLYWPVESFIGPIKLFHAPDFTLPPTLPGVKTILTVHDLSYVRAPETAHPAQKAFLDRAVPYSVGRADHILADSEATKQDLIELYHTSADKITVLLSGINPIYRPITNEQTLAQARQRYHIPPNAPYIFSIGTIQPRKNYARLIEAVNNLGPAYQDVHIVIAGGKGWLENPIYQTVQDLAMTERVHFTGFVADEDVPVLYSGAICTAYPSLYEGFGFPVLESMACHTPVLTSTVSSLPEVAGAAALMVDPYDVEAITDGLRRLLDDQTLRHQLVTAGQAQIQRFTWQQSASHLLGIYQQVLRL